MVGGILPQSSLVDVAVILVATAAIWVGSGWLEEAAETLSGYYGLPAVIQGSVVVAVGSSFPELVSVLLVGRVEVNFSTAVPMFGVLTAATVLLVAALRTDLSLTSRESYILLATYALFVAWVVAETIGLTGVLQGV